MMLHGGNIYKFSDEIQRTLLDFSANISPLGVPEKVKAAIINEIDQVMHYPDPLSARLSEAIANVHNISRDWVICGSGAADIIYRLVFGLKPKKALLVQPTFVEYAEAMRCVGTQMTAYPLRRQDFRLQRDVLQYMDESQDIMFICNPNNPTGVLTDRELLLEILKKAEACGMMLVIDECFLDFTGRESVFSLLGEVPFYNHLLILKSFTKMYGIPGVRLGYGICSDKAVMEKMRGAGQSWSVSTLAVSAGMAILRDNDYKAQVIAYIDREREYLEQALSRLNIRYFHGHANYILLYCPQIPDLYQQLLDAGILIRTCENYINLGADYYRIAINSHEANAALIAALERISSDC